MDRKIILIGAAVLLVMNITACGLKGIDNSNLGNGDETKTEKEYKLTVDGIIEPGFAREIIEQTADKVIRAISDKDAETLSKFVHPVKGLRFTPYTYVSLKEDKVLNREEVKDFFNDQRVYVWGVYDGIGDEISLTPGEYYKEFVYSRDFKNAERIGYNEVLSSGNAIENQFEVYDNPIIVEYYFPTLIPEDGGTDWKGLRLVFEQFEGAWKLMGIIHSQWTI